MNANDDAGSLTPRVILKSIVGTPPGASSLLQKTKVEPTAAQFDLSKT
ncbi:hypothetical protein PS726_01020 [Pseudomonas fluorescens]|nr:hypothetical protein [Pseudomonas fluorescens]VVN80149.1 hypothetical protein PS726_01020 [Pseudomonas fluorescens]